MIPLQQIFPEANSYPIIHHKNWYNQRNPRKPKQWPSKGINVITYVGCWHPKHLKEFHRSTKLTLCQRPSLSLGNLQSHFPKDALFHKEIFPNPFPSWACTLCLNYWDDFFYSPIHDHRKSLFICSIFVATFVQWKEIIRNVSQARLDHGNSST